jgi:hypothetical protein
MTNPFNQAQPHAEAAIPGEYVFDVPLTQVTSKAIRGFDAYWRTKAQDRRLPARPDIDPAEIKHLLPDIVLLNVEWDPFRCSVRLRGTRAEQFRPKGTTKYLDEGTTFAPGRKEDYIAEMKFVATEQRPAFARDWIITAARHAAQHLGRNLAAVGRRAAPQYAGGDRRFCRPGGRRLRPEVAVGHISSDKPLTAAARRAQRGQLLDHAM